MFESKSWTLRATFSQETLSFMPLTSMPIDRSKGHRRSDLHPVLQMSLGNLYSVTPLPNNMTRSPLAFCMSKCESALV